MIKFPCKCGQLFTVADDMAGGLVQCTRCGLLADVPSLNDIANITEEGIFKIDDAAPITDKIGVAELHEAFTRKTVNGQGREIDLRPDQEHYEKIGVPREVDALGYSPKYDPITGELIRVLDVIPDVPLEVIPAGSQKAVPALSYATANTGRQVTPATILLELFMPANAIVMSFVFIFYVIAGFAGTILTVYSIYFRFSLQVLNFPLWLILAHYGGVLEEMGPESQNELPRPLRHLDITDDLWNPFLRVMSAIFICFWPVMIVGNPHIHLGNAAAPLVILLDLAGSFFFPAVLLTTVTGTTLLNARPDRVIGVIRNCGPNYLLSVLTFLITVAPTEFYLIGRTSLPERLAELIPAGAGSPAIMLPLLATSVYLTHFFCWHLGLLYRAHHNEFPWLLQRHIPTRRDKLIAPPGNPGGKRQFEIL